MTAAEIRALVFGRHVAPAWTFGEGLDEAGLALLSASSWTVDREKRSVAVTCPAGTTFDAAEALRLELVARTPAGVAVDVQIAPAPPGTLSPEDEAGVRLFGELRAERLAPNPPPADDEPFPWDEPEGGAS